MCLPEETEQKMSRLLDPLHLSRFLRIYDDSASRMGIRVTVGFDFHEYVSITNSLSAKNKTYPNFQPDVSPIQTGDGYWIIGFGKNNDVALVGAARLYRLSQTNFAEHLESLKAFYANPSRDAHPQDRCLCTAPAARRISGKVAYHGDLWVRQDFRGQGMVKIATRIMRGVTFGMWDPDFLCSLAGRWSLDKKVYDPLHNEPGGAELHLVREDIVDNDWLFWLTGDELKELLTAMPDLA